LKPIGRGDLDGERMRHPRLSAGVELKRHLGADDPAHHVRHPRLSAGVELKRGRAAAAGGQRARHPRLSAGVELKHDCARGRGGSDPPSSPAIRRGGIESWMPPQGADAGSMATRCNPSLTGRNLPCPPPYLAHPSRAATATPRTKPAHRSTCPPRLSSSKARCRRRTLAELASIAQRAGSDGTATEQEISGAGCGAERAKAAEGGD
jgi:hypothetical protein